MLTQPWITPERGASCMLTTVDEVYFLRLGHGRQDFRVYSISGLQRRRIQSLKGLYSMFQKDV